MDREALAQMISSVLAQYGAKVAKPKKPKLPSDQKACRCGKPIPKEWPLCQGCHAWEEQDWLDGGPARRKTVFAVIREVNA